MLIIFSDKDALNLSFVIYEKQEAVGVMPLMLYKDVSKSRAFANHAWRYLKVPLYEGFVEEGGQKLADLSGQQAAEYFYRSKLKQRKFTITNILFFFVDLLF